MKIELFGLNDGDDVNRLFFHIGKNATYFIDIEKGICHLDQIGIFLGEWL